MSEPIEKEGVLSVFVSASSALSALGAGVTLLFLAFLVVLNVIVKGGSATGREAKFRAYLGPDLAATRRSKITVTADGKTLELLAMNPGSGTLEPIIYSWNPETGSVARTSASAGSQELSTVSELKFSLTKKSLNLYLKGDDEPTRMSWALNRWCLP